MLRWYSDCLHLYCIHSRLGTGFSCGGPLNILCLTQQKRKGFNGKASVYSHDCVVSAVNRAAKMSADLNSRRVFPKNAKLHIVNGGERSVIKNKWCSLRSALEKHSFGDKNEQLPRQQMHPDRYKQSQLWFLGADPRGLSEGKKAPGHLSGWPHPASVHSLTGLWLIQTRSYQIARRHSARYEGKYGTGAPGVTRLICAGVIVSVAYLQQKQFPAGQGIGRFVQSSVDTLTASWVMSFFQTNVCINVKPMAGDSSTPQVLHMSARGQFCPDCVPVSHIRL